MTTGLIGSGGLRQIINITNNMLGASMSSNIRKKTAAMTMKMANRMEQQRECRRERVVRSQSSQEKSIWGFV